MDFSRPKGVPRPVWNALSGKEKERCARSPKRFLDFTTIQTNSGMQQYGAGQTLSGTASGKAAADAEMGAVGGGINGNAARAARAAAAPRLGNVMRSRKRVVSEQPGLDRGKSPIIAMDEMVADIVSPSGGGFAVVGSFPIQPGIPQADGGSFPFAATIAPQYERWQVESMEYYVTPTVTAFASAGQGGRVVIAANFDSLAVPPANIQQALANDPHADGMPYEVVLLRLDPSRLTPDKGGKFTRTNFVTNSDLKTYDGGNLFVMCDGIQAGGVLIGQLRVKYSIRFFNPRLSQLNGAVQNLAFSSFVTTSNVLTTAVTSLTLIQPSLKINTTDVLLLGTNANPLNIKIVGNAGLQLPQGQFYLKYRTWFSAGGSGVPLAMGVMRLFYSDDQGNSWGDVGQLSIINGVTGPQVVAGTAYDTWGEFGIFAVGDGNRIYLVNYYVASTGTSGQMGVAEAWVQVGQA